MANFSKQPFSQFDLVASYESDGTTANENIAVRAFVLNPSGIEITGSPFTLIHKSYGVYQLNTAFTLDQVGIYKIIYRTYSIYPTRDFNWRDLVDYIDVKYEDTGSPVVLGSGDISKNAKEIAEAVWRYDTSKIKNEKTAIRQIFAKLNIEIPEVKFDEVISEISKIPSRVIIPEPIKPDYSKIMDFLMVLQQKIERTPDYSDIIRGLKNLSDKKDIKLAVNELINKLKRHIDIKTDKIVKINAKDFKIDFSDIYKSLENLNKEEAKRLKFVLSELKKHIDKKDNKLLLDNIIKSVDEKKRNKNLRSRLSARFGDRIIESQ